MPFCAAAADDHPAAMGRAIRAGDDPAHPLRDLSLDRGISCRLRYGWRLLNTGRAQVIVKCLNSVAVMQPC